MLWRIGDVHGNFEWVYIKRGILNIVTRIPYSEVILHRNDRDALTHNCDDGPVTVCVHIINNIVLYPLLSSITSPDLLSTKQINFKPVAGCRWPYRSRELETRDWSSVPGPDAAKHRKQQTWRELEPRMLMRKI